jgi:hypothetical protein
MKHGIRLSDLLPQWAEETGTSTEDLGHALADLLKQQDELPQGVTWVVTALGQRVADVEVSLDELIGYFRAAGRVRSSIAGDVEYHGMRPPVVVRRPQPIKQDADADELSISNYAALEAFGYHCDTWLADEVYISSEWLREMLAAIGADAPSCLQSEAKEDPVERRQYFLARKRQLKNVEGRSDWAAILAREQNISPRRVRRLVEEAGGQQHSRRLKRKSSGRSS